MLRSIKLIYSYINQSPSNKGQKLYRFFLALCWQLYKRIIGLPMISKLDNGNLFILYPNSTNSSGNIYVKTYESEYIFFLRQNLKTGGMMLDIGAHMGIFSLLLSNFFDSGYCFEPAHDNFNALENNIFLNRLNFTAIPKAVSDDTKSVQFQISGEFSGTNKVLANVDNSSSIQAIQIDEFIEVNNINPLDISFIKIDTEGHELNVLKGMEELLKRNKKMLILLEAYDYEQLNSFFKKIDYQMFVINEKGEKFYGKQYFSQAANYFSVGPEHFLFEKQ